MTTTQRYYVAHHIRVGTWRVYKPTGICLKYDFTSEPSAAFWADQLNEAMRRGAIEQQRITQEISDRIDTLCSEAKQGRDLPKESLPEFGKEVKQQQPMTATEFPMKELVSWIVELHTTLLTNVGLTPGTRDALDKALLEYQKAAHEKGLL